MVTAIVVFYFILTMGLDFRITIKSGKHNEIWIYSVCFLIGFAVLFLRSLDIAVPGPSRFIVNLLEKLSLIK
jgi:hypothetical protein